MKKLRDGRRPANRVGMILAVSVVIGSTTVSIIGSRSAHAAILAPHGSDRSHATESRRTSSIQVGGTLFFDANDGTHGYELWKSDGTARGTSMVKDIFRGSRGSYPYNLTAIGSTLYFDAYEASHGGELWRSDGTHAGTFLVKDIMPGATDSDIGYPVAVGHTLLFTANDGVHGQELWRSDGTTKGTLMVKDIRSGSGSSDPYSLTEADGMVFFTARDGNHGRELWRSDGTASGTAMVKDIFPGSVGGLSGYGPTFAPVSLISVGGSVFFQAIDGPDRVLDLWTSDGAAAGTLLLLATTVRPYSREDPPIYEMAGVGGALYFAMMAPNDDGELWKSDGTASGTVEIADVLPGVYWAFSLGSFTDVGGTLYFEAASHLWKSDGTAGGTVQVKPIPPAYRLRSFSLVSLGNTLYFSASDLSHGFEPWTSDGTAGGTFMVSDVSTGSRGSAPGFFCDAEGAVYFAADDHLHGAELWRSDGTGAGTVMVKDIYSGPKGSTPSDLVFVPA